MKKAYTLSLFLFILESEYIQDGSICYNVYKGEGCRYDAR